MSPNSTATVFERVSYVDLVPPEKHPAFDYEGFHPGKTVQLPRGHVLREGYGAFPVNTALDIDSKVPMRDGVDIYTNVYRPADGRPQPALIAWSPYGKCSGGSGAQNYDVMGPYRMGIPYHHLSGYETFEGPNPADWVARGYCVIDVDARGSMHSGGDIAFWGQQEAEDVYDLIEWCSKQAWCDGSAVMFGNSWLAIAQTNHASRCPHPALKAIAPWEAANDVYKQFLCRGGVTTKIDDFAKAQVVSHIRRGDELLTRARYRILGGLAGYNKAEGCFEAVSARPMYDDYWASKHIAAKHINIPTYLTASYSSRLHSQGSFENFARAKPDLTWLRVHDSQEWHDLYKPHNMDDLQKFYDRFAKNKSNGWDETPHLRLSLIGMVGSVVGNVVERSESAMTYPISSVRTKKLFFNAASMEMQANKPPQASTASYEGHSMTDQISFTATFKDYTELSGFPWARLSVSCQDHDDMDLHIQIRKTGINGQLLSWNNYPVPVPVGKIPSSNVAIYQGPNGILRASHSVSQEPKEDADAYPKHTHTTREAIERGSIVTVEIPIRPIGMVFGEGEGISVIIAGHDLVLPELEAREPVTAPNDLNVGRHVLHAGGEHDSFLMLPFLKG